MKNPHPRVLASPIPAVLSTVLLMSIGPALADAPGAKEGLLASCPNRNNCVSSDSLNEKYQIAPFKLAMPPEQAWKELQQVIEATPDTKIVQVTPDYIHAEYTTQRLRLTDDVEFVLKPERKEIAVRSASRVGYYDFGANRKRVEALRAQLREKGIVE